MSEIKQNVSVVTGGAKGIGLAIVEALLKSNANVFLPRTTSAHEERIASFAWVPHDPQRQYNCETR